MPEILETDKKQKTPEESIADYVNDLEKKYGTNTANKVINMMQAASLQNIVQLLAQISQQMQQNINPGILNLGNLKGGK